MLGKSDRIECTFIAVYFIEQIALVLLYTFFSEKTGLWIGLFPVIFLTTIAFEKTLLKADFKEQLENSLKENSVELEKKKDFDTFRRIFRNKISHNHQ